MAYEAYRHAGFQVGMRLVSAPYLGLNKERRCRYDICCECYGVAALLWLLLLVGADVVDVIVLILMLV